MPCSVILYLNCRLDMTNLLEDRYVRAERSLAQDLILTNDLICSALSARTVLGLLIFERSKSSPPHTNIRRIERAAVWQAGRSRMGV